MAISRFILQHWPHLDWYPWWFAGEPFENSYTPLLNLIDAGFAWAVGCSTARAFNFVTAFFYIAGPFFLFVFSWRVSKRLETSFFCALIYSLFSSCVVFPVFRSDIGFWNPWRLRVLVSYGEGPHTAVLSLLPVCLLLTYLAIDTRKYIWSVAAGAGMSILFLINAFGTVDLMVGSACLILARELKEIPRAVIRIVAIAAGAYLAASPFMPPSLLQTISTNSQRVDGDFSGATLLPAQCMIAAAFAAVWFATRRIPSYFSRFSVLFAFVFLAITGFYAIWNRAALPQPHRYSLEMDLAIPLALTMLARPVVLRLPHSARVAGAALLALLAIHQFVQFRHYGRSITQKIDITQTIEYKVAKAFDRKLGGLRVFAGGLAGTWLNVFSDTPQMNSGHDPFSPNWVEQIATYSIYSSMNTGPRDAEISILWLKAFGCHAIYVPGPKSRLGAEPFIHPEKFAGVLPVLWHEEDDTIYSIPQRTKSLAHVIPAGAAVRHQPLHALDTAETTAFVAALDDAAMPLAGLIWQSPSEAQIRTVLRPGQVLSLQITYDPGWVATANGQPTSIVRDGIGFMRIHPPCDGECTVRLVFDGGLERRICRFASWTVSGAALLGFLALGRKKLRS